MPRPPECDLRVGDLAVVVDLSAGARASSLTFAGQELLHRRGDDPVENGMYPMGPWAGRIRDNTITLDAQVWKFPPRYHDWALHGLLLAARAEPVEIVRESSEQRLRAVVRTPDPMRTIAEIEWTVRAGEVTTRISIEPVSGAIPVVTGWHPWFRRHLAVGSSLEWSLGPATVVERGDDYLPTGQLLPFDASTGPFDDAFRAVTQQAMVRWPGFASIMITNDSPWFVVYDEVVDCVCVEPQSGPPNGVNDGLGDVIAVARPGDPVVGLTRWNFRSEDPGDAAGPSNGEQVSHAEQAGQGGRFRWWQRIGRRRP